MNIKICIQSTIQQIKWGIDFFIPLFKIYKEKPEKEEEKWVKCGTYRCCQSPVST